MTVQFVGEGSINNSNAGRLVARYVHKGNYVIQPTALDKPTGIFTCAGGLLANVGASGFVTSSGTTIIGIGDGGYVTGVLPREINPNNYHQIEVINDTTFYLQGNESGSYARMTFPDANNTAVDPTKFFFEVNCANVTIDLMGLNLTEIIARMLIRRNRSGWPYTYLRGVYGGAGTSFANQLGTTSVDGRDTAVLFKEEYWRYDPSSGIIVGQVIRTVSKTWNNTNGSWTITGNSEVGNRDIWHYENFKMTGYQVSPVIGNGSVIEIFDTRGVV